MCARGRRPAKRAPHGYLLQSVGKALTLIEFISREPALGEHTREILAMLGYRDADIARLMAEGIIEQHGTYPDGQAPGDASEANTRSSAPLPNRDDSSKGGSGP